ncbi:MAG: site-specific integrase [Rhodomicrobium sp.]
MREVVKLTDGLAARLVVPEGKKEILVFDDLVPGFFVRKYASGEASFCVKYSIGKKQRRIVLGNALDKKRGRCEAMRMEAYAIWADARRGIDEAGKREARRKAVQAEEAASVTIGSLITPFLKTRKERYSAAWFTEVQRYLQGGLKELHPVPVEKLSRSLIVAALDSVEAASGAVSSDRAKAALSSFLAWLVERQYLEANPADGISRRARGGGRERVLSEGELVALWNACAGEASGAIIRLLVLTGARKSEIANLEWSEVDFEAVQVTLSGRRTKNNHPFVIPLSGEAVEILRSSPHYDNGLFVFSTGRKSWSDYKVRLDAKLPAGMPHWTFHDIRRSVSTHLNELGFAPPHIVEAILNHVSGHKRGVAGTYNRALYMPERRRALDMWAAHITALVDGKESNVIALRPAQAQS